MIYKIEQKSRGFINELLASGRRSADGKYSPRGWFYCIDHDRRGNAVYIAVDNSTGDAWTEEYGTYEECISFLEDGPYITGGYIE